MGLNNAPAVISNSWASGAVTGTGKVQMGGLVGGNFSTITGSYATGPVGTTGTNNQGIAGGLVGLNVGAINNSHAEGPVTINQTGGNSDAGGLVGLNQSGGTVSNSYATGSVTLNAPGGSASDAGGLVGDNDGQIVNSYATGAVHVTEGQGAAGGLVGYNSNSGTISNSHATGNVLRDGNDAELGLAGGLVGANQGLIDNSYATGNVTLNTTLGGAAGGLVGSNESDISNSHATGAVSSTGVFALAGGLIGINLGGDVDHAYATGNVNVAGTVGAAGGFAGLNVGFLTQTFSTGAVGGSATLNALGGFVGINANTVQYAYATGAVTGSGTSLVGGFAGVNVGSLDQAYAIGKLTGGTVTGGLVAVSSNSLGPINPLVDPLLAGTGTATNSYWDTRTTGVSTSAGGEGRTTRGLISTLPPGFDHGDLDHPARPQLPVFPLAAVQHHPDDARAAARRAAVAPAPAGDHRQPDRHQPVHRVRHPAAFNAQGGVRLPQFPAATPGQPGQQPGILPRVIDIPPLTETRLVANEVVLQIRCEVGTAQLEQAVQAPRADARRIAEPLQHHRHLGAPLPLPGRTDASAGDQRARGGAGDRGRAAELQLRAAAGRRRARRRQRRGRPPSTAQYVVAEAAARPTCTARSRAPTSRSR